MVFKMTVLETLSKRMRNKKELSQDQALGTTTQTDQAEEKTGRETEEGEGQEENQDGSVKSQRTRGENILRGKRY